MTGSDTCRHGLLTYERNGESLHRHDGSRCETTPSHAPEGLAYERRAERVVERETTGEKAAVATATLAPPPAPTEPTPPPTPTPPTAPPEPPLEVFDQEIVEPVDTTPARRRRRPWLVVLATLAGVVILAAGVGIGIGARNHAVDQQKRRTAAAEKQVSSLRDQVSSKQATIDDEQRQIATSRDQQDQLQRRNAQLQAEAARNQPSGPNATSFSDGLYQAGVGIQPGQYRTDGTDSCYWAKLSTGDTNSIIDSNLGAGPQTVTIDSPYFESENCGTWTKVA